MGEPAAAHPGEMSAADRALLDRHCDLLLKLARRSIDHRLAQGRVLLADPADFAPELGEHRAVFVTLTRSGSLQGCVGTPVAFRPLVVDVAENAAAAAVDDPRFAPLAATEAACVEIEISLLGAPERLHATTEAELLTALVPGRDGLILRAGDRRALFLPKVWEVLPEPADFIAHLYRKAGLRPGRWIEDMVFHRFASTSISERRYDPAD